MRCPERLIETEPGKLLLKNIAFENAHAYAYTCILVIL